MPRRHSASAVGDTMWRWADVRPAPGIWSGRRLELILLFRGQVLLSFVWVMHGIFVRLHDGRLVDRGGFIIEGLIARRLQQQTPELAPRGDLHRVLRDGRVG